MSRSGYSEDIDDQWQWIKWRGTVASSIRGKRGQAFLRDLLDALDAMPVKRLIAHELRERATEVLPKVFVGGEVCTLGAIGVQRSVALESIDPEDHGTLGQIFNISGPLVQEIESENDEGSWNETPEKRWLRMRRWVASNIKPPA